MGCGGIAPRQDVFSNHQHIAKMASKIDPKSMKNRGCVADPFLERLGAALGCQMFVLGRQKLQNITKMAPQIYEKSRLRRGSVWGAFWGGTGPLKNLTISSFWMHFGDHFRQNIQNIHPKRHPGEVSKK